ncbi:MAG: AAC(3) family N-acetyltransferase [Pseudomonadota bacterium]
MHLFGKNDLIKDLSALGIDAGDGLFVHSALGQIGHVIGGPRTLIEALIDLVGPEGLIGMPGFSTDAYDPAELMDLPLDPLTRDYVKRQVPGFDPALSSARDNGSVPESFRTWPGVFRSKHPTSSVLLLGPDARRLIRPHDPLGWATGPNSPWGRLRKRPQMKILLLGVGWNRCSALHAAESLANHRRLKIRHFKNGTGPDAPWVEAPDVADDLGRLFPSVGADWEADGGVVRGRVGNAAALLTGYSALLDYASIWFNRRNRSDGVPSIESIVG